MKDYAREVAKAGLEIGAIKLKPDDPFQWASGYKMPIYNDNRMLLGQHKQRMLVAEGFKNIIETEKIPYDYIAGTSTAGIAPATSIANLLGVSLLIIEDGIPYEFKQPLENQVEGYYQECQAIASTCPWAIPFGITLANKRALPFMYVRQSKKEHGLKQQIEGNPKPGQNVFLMDYHRGDSYLENAVKALGEAGLIIAKSDKKDVTSKVEPLDIKDKKIIVIEDLISTGGSSVKEVKAYREKGGIVTHCISIFNYGLDKAIKQFEEEDCEVRSILIYEILLGVAKEANYVTEDEGELLKEWRADPFNWGEKHGFPKVEKS